MASLSREEVLSVIGPSDEATVAEIIATQATLEELALAWAWAKNDEALINQGRPLPSGRVAELVELLSPQEEDEPRAT